MDTIKFEKKLIINPLATDSEVYLRKLSVYDDKAIFALRSNPEVNRYVTRKSCKTIEEAGNFIQTVLSIEENKLFYWVIILKERDQLIGTICLANVSIETSTAEIGYELLPAFQNKGFMQACISTVIEFGFKQLNLKMIEANTDDANIKSVHLLKKYGFVKDAHPSNSESKKYSRYVKFR